MLLLLRQSPSLKLFRIFYDSLPKPDEIAAMVEDSVPALAEGLRVIHSAAFSASFATQGCIPHSREAFAPLFVTHIC